MKQNGASRSQGALMNMRGRRITGSPTKGHSPLLNGAVFLLISFSFLTLTTLNYVSAADDNHNNHNDDLIQGYSLGPEIATTEFGKYRDLLFNKLVENRKADGKIDYKR